MVTGRLHYRKIKNGGVKRTHIIFIVETLKKLLVGIKRLNKFLVAKATQAFTAISNSVSESVSE